jgi:hypothetical protein
MFKQSKEEKDFFEIKNNELKPNELSKLSDRELQERQTEYLFEIMKSNQKISLMMQFWFYLSIISLLITILVFK